MRESLESEDVAEINAKTDALQAAFHKVSEQMYAAAAQASRRGDGGAGDGVGDRRPAERGGSRGRRGSGR